MAGWSLYRTARLRGGASTHHCMQTLSVSVTPTLWPLFEDAILIGASGLVRSARLGSTVDAKAALLSVAPCRDGETGGSDACGVLIAVAAAPAASLAIVQAIWSASALPNNSASAQPFTITLTGVCHVVLRARNVAFTNTTTLLLGGAACVVQAVSSDGRWLLLTSPSPVDICGSNTTECGYAPLAATNAATRSTADCVNNDASLSCQPPFNVTVACPPICPNTVGVAGAVPFAPAVAGVITLAVMPSAGSGAMPALVPIPESTSVGVYYALACVQV